MVLRVDEFVNFFCLLRWKPFGVEVAVAMLNLRREAAFLDFWSRSFESS